MTSFDPVMKVLRENEPEIRFWAILEWYWLHLDRFELILGHFAPHVLTNGVIFKWKYYLLSVYSEFIVII